MATQPLRFHGQYTDTVTGLADMRMRDYSAADGRFTAIDPAPAPVGAAFAQTYHYGNNNPTGTQDPSGACHVCVTAAAGLAVGAIIGMVAGGIEEVHNGGNFANGARRGLVIGAVTGLVGGLTLNAGAAMAATAAVSVAAGFVSSAWTGQSYGAGEAVRDAALGALPLGLGRSVGVIGRSLADNVDAARHADFGAIAAPRPRDVRDIQCPPDATPESTIVQQAATIAPPHNFATERKLERHFRDHGADFAVGSADEYADLASAFLSGNKPDGVLERMRPDGDIVGFDPDTDEFGVISAAGVIRTFYKPDPARHSWETNLEYFLNER